MKLNAAIKFLARRYERLKQRLQEVPTNGQEGFIKTEMAALRVVVSQAVVNDEELCSRAGKLEELIAEELLDVSMFQYMEYRQKRLKRMREVSKALQKADRLGG